jgi:hypothetical protein
VEGDLENVMTSLRSRAISRRTLIKGGAIVGGTIWAAPVIDSFVSPAFASGSRQYGCCACYDPSGALIAGAADDLTSSNCVSFCQSVVSGGHGSYVLFNSGKSQFTYVQPPAPSGLLPACSSGSTQLSITSGTENVCPSPIAGFTCSTGKF